MDIKNTKNQIIIVLTIVVIILACCIVYNYNKAKRIQKKTVTSPVVEDVEMGDTIMENDQENEREWDISEYPVMVVPKKIQIFEMYRNREYSLREASKRYSTSERNFLTQYNEYVKNYG